MGVRSGVTKPPSQTAIHRFTHLRAFEVKDRKPRKLPQNDVYVLRYSNIAHWVDCIEQLGIKSVNRLPKKRDGDGS